MLSSRDIDDVNFFCFVGHTGRPVRHLASVSYWSLIIGLKRTEPNRSELEEWCRKWTDGRTPDSRLNASIQTAQITENVLKRCSWLKPKSHRPSDATRRDQTVLWRRVAGRVNAALTRRGAARRGARATRGRCMHLSELATSTNRSHTTLYPHYATLRYARYVRARAARRLARPAMFGKCRTVQVYRFSRSVRRRLN